MYHYFGKMKSIILLFQEINDKRTVINMPDLTGVQIIWHYITVVAEWVMNNLLILNALLAIAIVFFQRRDPKTVWTWLLVLYFIPIAGFVLYLLLG